jgi:hypothetical protein
MAEPIPKPPSELRGRGRGLWLEVQRRFELDPIEEQLLRELCRAVDRADVIAAQLDSAQLVVAGSTGQPRVHPLLGALQAQEKLIDRLCTSLGVSAPGTAGEGRPRGHPSKAQRVRWARAGKAASVTSIGARDA